MVTHSRGRAVYSLAIGVYIALVLWGPNSTPPRSLYFLLGFAALMCFVSLVSIQSTAKSFTVISFATIGVSLGIGVFGVLGLGLPGLVPPVLMVIGTWMLRDRLDGSAVIPATAACCAAMLSPLLLMLAR